MFVSLLKKYENALMSWMHWHFMAKLFHGEKFPNKMDFMHEGKRDMETVPTMYSTVRVSS